MFQIFLILLFIYTCYSESSHKSSSFSILDEKYQNLLKTGTTIVGICCEDGVILGADTRVTMGSIVSGKTKQKIHRIADKIYCCTAGTVADCDYAMKKSIHLLNLHKLRLKYLIDNNNEDESLDSIDMILSSLINSCNTIEFHHEPQIALILGGYDYLGPRLYSINDISSQCAYCSLGSGSSKSYSLLENELQNIGINITEFDQYIIPNLSITEAINLIRKSVLAGIHNDLGSGSHIDFVQITANETKTWREVLHTQLQQQVSTLQNEVTSNDINDINDIQSQDLGELIMNAKELQNILTIELLH